MGFPHVEHLLAFLVGLLTANRMHGQDVAPLSEDQLAGLTDGDRRLAEMMASGKVDTMSQGEMDKLFGEREAA